MNKGPYNELAEMMQPKQTDSNAWIRIGTIVQIEPEIKVQFGELLAEPEDLIFTRSIQNQLLEKGDLVIALKYSHSFILLDRMVSV